MVSGDDGLRSGPNLDVWGEPAAGGGRAIGLGCVLRFQARALLGPDLYTIRHIPGTTPYSCHTSQLTSV